MWWCTVKSCWTMSNNKSEITKKKCIIWTHNTPYNKNDPNKTKRSVYSIDSRPFALEVIMALQALCLFGFFKHLLSTFPPYQFWTGSRNLDTQRHIHLREREVFKTASRSVGSVNREWGCLTHALSNQIQTAFQSCFAKIKPCLRFCRLNHAETRQTLFLQSTFYDIFYYVKHLTALDHRVLLALLIIYWLAYL